MPVIAGSDESSHPRAMRFAGLRLPCIVIALLFLRASPLAGQTPEFGNIAIFADSARTASEVWGSGYHPFTVYFFCRPGSDGMMCAEYAVSYPSSVIPGDVASNAGISVELGTLQEGMSVCFSECRTDWVWTHSQQCFLTEATPTSMRIVAHALSGGIYQASCLDGLRSCGPFGSGL